MEEMNWDLPWVISLHVLLERLPRFSSGLRALDRKFGSHDHQSPVFRAFA
jgi:hypothetical protein